MQTNPMNFQAGQTFIWEIKCNKSKFLQILITNLNSQVLPNLLFTMPQPLSRKLNQKVYENSFWKEKICGRKAIYLDT